MILKIASGALALALIAGTLWWSNTRPETTQGQLLGSASAETAAPATTEPTDAAAIDPALLGDRTLGDPNAPIKLTEYTPLKLSAANTPSSGDRDKAQPAAQTTRRKRAANTEA